MKNKNEIMLFELQQEQMANYEECHNYLGFTKIEILEFNFDGKGNVLILEDEDLAYLSFKALGFVMFSGWYKLIRCQ
jgi:hypothetical protein